MFKFINKYELYDADYLVLFRVIDVVVVEDNPSIYPVIVAHRRREW